MDFLDERSDENEDDDKDGDSDDKEANLSFELAGVNLDIISELAETDPKLKTFLSKQQSTFNKFASMDYVEHCIVLCIVFTSYCIALYCVLHCIVLYIAFLSLFF
jgi:hypothetical protein